ncbi:hypothetical protein MSG28_005364 [Choristoneura fumiferana]|uniref:Uncharacterized protein n=1 Tax=Choristoneura fumiferana TaxID=7141 RepID=A0ACC0JQY9_CHOFU|nr:hypothetical protein MSG28_005364 [Choristoneura fumiferana]
MALTAERLRNDDSVLVANYVSCLDSLAASHVLGTISLRKWKVPPFFASTLGIRNAAQFVRKQHFGECPSKPVLLQPEGGPTNGRGLLKFTDWPFPVGSRVQPVAITVERPFTSVTVHGAGAGAGAEAGAGFPWRDALWFLAAPLTVYTLRLLPAVAAPPDALPAEVANVIAQHLQIEATDILASQLSLAPARAPAAPRREPRDLTRRAQQVKEVLPRVPLQDILRDLAITRSVDVTITNFLEGVTPYTPEPEPAPVAGPSQPKYVTPAPQAVFPKSAKERQLSFQERKAQMIAEARQRYIAKHGMQILNC